MSAFSFLYLLLRCAYSVFLHLNGYFYGLSFKSFFSRASLIYEGAGKKATKLHKTEHRHKVKRSGRMLPLLK